MSILWSLHLRREAASVPLARRLLVGAMETAGVDPDVSYDLSVALTEACTNAVAHGGSRSAAAGSPGAYQVTAYLDGEKCHIEVADSGPGFPAGNLVPPARPTPYGAEHGRGMYLIEELSDHVHFGNKPGRNGAVVRFDKILKWREGALLQASRSAPQKRGEPFPFGQRPGAGGASAAGGSATYGRRNSAISSSTDVSSCS